MIVFAYLTLQQPDAYAGWFGNKDASIEHDRDYAAATGYLGLAVAIGSGKKADGITFPELGYWQTLHVENLDTDKEFEISPLADLATPAKIYIGKLPVGRYRLVKLSSELVFVDKGFVVTYRFNPDKEFAISADVLTDLNGMAYFDSDISLEPKKSFFARQLDIGINNQSMFAFGLHFKTDAVKTIAQRKITAPYTLVDWNTTYTDTQSLTDVQLPVAIDNGLILDQPSTYRVLLGRFGKAMINAPGQQWQRIDLPTFYAVTAAELVAGQQLIIGTEFGRLYRYDLNKKRWLDAPLHLPADHIALLDNLGDGRLLAIMNTDSIYSAAIIDSGSWQTVSLLPTITRQETDYFDLYRSMTSDSVFKLRGEDSGLVYFIADDFYRLQIPSNTFKALRKKLPGPMLQQGNLVLRAARKVSYDNAQEWENPIRATRVSDALERKAFAYTTRQLLKAVPLTESRSAEQQVIGAEFFNSRNFARHWDLRSSLENDCRQILHAVSTDQELHVYCSNGWIRTSRDHANTWQVTYQLP